MSFLVARNFAPEPEYFGAGLDPNSRSYGSPAFMVDPSDEPYTSANTRPILTMPRIASFPSTAPMTVPTAAPSPVEMPLPTVTSTPSNDGALAVSAELIGSYARAAQNGRTDEDLVAELAQSTGYPIAREVITSWMKPVQFGSQSPEEAFRAFSAAHPVSTVINSPNEQMSLLGKIGGALSGIGKVAGGFLAGGPVGAGVAAAGLLRGGTPKLAAPTLTSSGLAGLGGLIGRLPKVGGVGAAVGIGSTVAGLLPGLKPGASSGCGCNGSGRDPCTGHKTSGQAAPLATFFGGCCPPGRVLRRVNNGRDVCMRKPRMNPFNPAALARADRRVTSFSRRSAAILRDMGYTVSARKPKALKAKKRRR